MIDTQTFTEDVYKPEFIPSFNKELWEQYMNNTPTSFPTLVGDTVNFRKEFVKNILMDIRDMFYFKMDVFHLAQGDEGAGKSHFMAQVAWVYYWFMKELGMVDYRWNLDLVFFSLDKLNDSFNYYRYLPFYIYILDEGDELSGENFWQPNNKRFRQELRRGRKFGRLIFVNMPQVKEITSRIATTRGQKFYDIVLERDIETFDILRGDVGVWGIPRGSKAWSEKNQEWIPKNKIRNRLSALFKSKDDFITFPRDLQLFDLRCNKARVFDEKEYEKKAAKETIELLGADVTVPFTKKDRVIMNMIFEFLGKNALVKALFGDNEANKRAFFRLRKKFFGDTTTNDNMHNNNTDKESFGAESAEGGSENQ